MNEPDEAEPELNEDERKALILFHLQREMSNDRAA
jgi:hypothetical protein